MLHPMLSAMTLLAILLSASPPWAHAHFIWLAPIGTASSDAQPQQLEIFFSESAFAAGGKLYISTISGTLQRLSDDGSAWRVVGQTPVPRFFHRMLPAGDDSLVVIGAANMRGRIKEVERFTLPSVERSTTRAAAGQR